MAEMIRDGVGKGYLAKVTNENKLLAYCTTESEASYESETNHRCYSWTNASAYAAGAADTVLLLKNTSSTLNLIIQDFYVQSSAATEFVIHSPTCDTPTGTTIAGINLNRTSSLAADATCIQDETTNTQANVIYRGYVAANVAPFQMPEQGIIILGNNNCIAIDFMDAATARCTIIGYFHIAN